MTTLESLPIPVFEHICLVALRQYIHNWSVGSVVYTIPTFDLDYQWIKMQLCLKCVSKRLYDLVLQSYKHYWKELYVYIWAFKCVAPYSQQRVLAYINNSARHARNVYTQLYADEYYRQLVEPKTIIESTLANYTECVKYCRAQLSFGNSIDKKILQPMVVGFLQRNWSTYAQAILLYDPLTPMWNGRHIHEFTVQEWSLPRHLFCLIDRSKCSLSIFDISVAVEFGWCKQYQKGEFHWAYEKWAKWMQSFFAWLYGQGIPLALVWKHLSAVPSAHERYCSDGSYCCEALCIFQYARVCLGSDTRLCGEG